MKHAFVLGIIYTSTGSPFILSGFFLSRQSWVMGIGCLLVGVLSHRAFHHWISNMFCNALASAAQKEPGGLEFLVKLLERSTNENSRN